LPPTNNSDPVGYFLGSVNELFEYAMQDVSASDMVEITFQNPVNKNDKPIGISFRRKVQLSGEVNWSVFEKVSQSNSRFNAFDTLVVTVHSVKMSVVFGYGIKIMRRTLSVMAHLKKRIVEVKVVENCLAHALMIAIAKVDNDANYKAYSQGWKILPVDRDLLETTGIDLASGGEIPKLARFHEHFSEYMIVVYQGLRCDNIIFEGRVESVKRLNLLYDEVEWHCHVITNLTGAMANPYACKACNKSCRIVITLICDLTCSDFMTNTPCAFSEVRISCDECNRHFRCRKCFDNLKQSTAKRK